MPQIGEKCKRERENKPHRRADRAVRPYKGVKAIHFPIGIP